MRVLHRDRNAVILVHVIDLFATMAVCSGLACPVVLVIHDDWHHEAEAVHLCVVALDMAADQRMVLTQPITYHYHIFGGECIETDVEVKKCKVLDESLAPFPG